ncbi:hypothetical protein LY76DRAFT_301553 [Colletotrichum caudatum]|nr:hypothetical protein LY76DRAFT_301553 [Colletotrichum caudatum]
MQVGEVRAFDGPIHTAVPQPRQRNLPGDPHLPLARGGPKMEQSGELEKGKGPQVGLAAPPLPPDDFVKVPLFRLNGPRPVMLQFPRRLCGSTIPRHVLSVESHVVAIMFMSGWRGGSQLQSSGNKYLPVEPKFDTIWSPVKAAPFRRLSQPSFK